MNDTIRSMGMSLFVLAIIGGLWVFAAAQSELSLPPPVTRAAVDSTVTSAPYSDVQTETVFIVRSNTTPARPAL